MTKPVTTFSRLTTLLLLTFVVLNAVATLFVITSALPPVFNQSQRNYKLVNIFVFVGLVACALILATTLFTTRLDAATRVLKLFATWIISIQLLLVVFDTYFISVDKSLLPGAFRNASAGDGDIVLHPSTSTSPFGFDTWRTDGPKKKGYRVLFLGNSYLRGIGTAGAPSYPRAVDITLKESVGAEDISVFSAGVSGAGVRDDFYIYQMLLERGYQFDAVVLNIMMQADLTNNIPGTMRRAVAGQPQRFHDSAFLRYFYPLNSTLFRYLVYFQVRFGQKWAADDGPQQDASCRMSPGFSSFVKERAAYYYGPKARSDVFLDYNLEQALRIQKLAENNGARMFAVLLPDPNSALDDYRSLLGSTPMDWDWTRKAVVDRLSPNMPVLDLAQDFRNQYRRYRCNDTHWSAEGNLVGGKLVGHWLANSIKNSPAKP